MSEGARSPSVTQRAGSACCCCRVKCRDDGEIVTVMVVVVMIMVIMVRNGRNEGSRRIAKRRFRHGIYSYISCNICRDLKIVDAPFDARTKIMN